MTPALRGGTTRPEHGGFFFWSQRWRRGAAGGGKILLESFPGTAGYDPRLRDGDGRWEACHRPAGRAWRVINRGGVGIAGADDAIGPAGNARFVMRAQHLGARGKLGQVGLYTPFACARDTLHISRLAPTCPR